MYEKNFEMFMTVFDCPEATLCSLRDVKIQLQNN